MDEKQEMLSDLCWVVWPWLDTLTWVLETWAGGAPCLLLGMKNCQEGGVLLPWYHQPSLVRVGAQQQGPVTPRPPFYM